MAYLSTVSSWKLAKLTIHMDNIDMVIILSMLIGLKAHALSEADRDLIAAHKCFAELDRHSAKGRKIVPSSKSNIKQVANTSHKSDDEHWMAHDYALWNSRSKNLHYISIRRNFKPKSPAYIVRHISSNESIRQNSDKVVLNAGDEGSSCPVHVDLKKGIQNQEATVYQMALGYKHCSKIEETLEVEAGPDEVTEEIVDVFESSISKRLSFLTPQGSDKTCSKTRTRKTACESL